MAEAQVSKKAQRTPQENMQRSSVSKSFDLLSVRLNAGQKRAVETIEGPVMVVAGPGTGKTHVLGMRVANILKKTQMRPSNILCLTFSVSAATQMRERLRSFIGPDAYGVTVKNFHGFCNDLIAQHPLVFDSWSALEQISDVERYRELNTIIDQLLPNLVLVNKKNPYLRTRDIISRISQLKRESKADRKELEQIADEYEEKMSSKSKEGTKAHEKNVLQARKFKEFIEVFFRYQEMLKNTGRFDYEDMILYVIKALEEEDWLLAALQERYQYILVDEFQDTNGAQYRLIELLTTYSSLDHEPNLFVVGDDDQAIYRFQGANLANILSFHNRFPKAPVVTLTESYRCTQPILDAAGSLIANNTERLVGHIKELEKDLTAAKQTEGADPQLLFSPSDTTEPWMLADLVEERLKQGLKPDDIAILVQTNKELLPLYDVFTARNLPVQMTGKVDLLAHPLVQQAIAILKAVESPDKSVNMGAALSCACFECHPADLASLFAKRIEEKKTLSSLLLEIDKDESLRDKNTLIKVRDVLFDLHNKLGNRTVVDTLQHLLEETGLLDLARGKKEGTEFDPINFAALQEFFDRLKMRAYEQPSFSFKSFLSDLEYYQQPEYGDLRLSYSLPHLTEKGVQLMTAHQSKGMEFETVILANFRDKHWDKRFNRSGLSVPEDLLFGWDKDQKSFEKNQDERRLAYVAMTRAKRELIFTCPKELTTGDKSREVSPSAFFAEAGSLLEEMRDLKDPTNVSLFLHKSVRKFDQEMEAFLQQRLENYKLSVTALNHFLEDPQKFLEVDLLRVPQAKQPSFVYGNAVHDALKKWGLSVQQGKPLDQKGFMNAFNTYMDERELLTDKEKAILLKIGEETLPRYFDQKIAQVSPIIYKVEFGIQTFFDDPSDPVGTSVPIKGALDRIDLYAPDSSLATVIDYKTGRPKTEKQIRDDGDYFRQLAFYALLLEQKSLPIEPQEFVLEFIGEGTDHPVTRAFAITQSELDDLKKVVKEVWGRIVALDFTPID
ncbi:ATP-dependent helicase [Patescibacteria group bacterium]|nr:ATP-dependent helicase [Patescibacteria group bacterium]